MFIQPTNFVVPPLSITTEMKVTQASTFLVATSGTSSCGRYASIPFYYFPVANLCSYTSFRLPQDTINSTLLSGRTADIGDQEIFWEEVRKDKYHIVQSFPSCTKMDNVDPQNWVACALDKCRFTAGMLVSNVTHGGLEPALKDAYSKAGGMVLPDLAVALRPGWNVSSNASAMHNPLKPVTEHANWIKGNKRKELLMRAYGYWIMPDTTPPILPDHP